LENCGVTFLWTIGAQIAETVWGFLPATIAFAIIFSVLTLFSSQACNPGRTWWRNPGLFTDICYIVIVPFVAPYMRMSLMIAGATLLSGVMNTREIADYFEHGRGPLGGLPFWGQAAVYFGASDFLLYWTHRIFHGATMWRFHAIHHSAEEVDWTTAYRFHPVNLWLGSFLVTAIMLYLGVSPAVLLFLVPFDTALAAFVHANLNWTLGPLKYVMATPVFHRWHHTMPEAGGNTNFGSSLAIWDVLFGTFRMPAGELPKSYGVDEAGYPQDFLGQFVHPFRPLIAPAPGAAQGEPTSSPPAA
jgi:sterol desaturase/sphingolipid hydroxylase (fatty acid hydroxylase superfamily)